MRGGRRVNNQRADLCPRLGCYAVEPNPRYVFANTRSVPPRLRVVMTVRNLGEGRGSQSPKNN